jgi:bifunctional DNA-binding transcriptional regulator/antitoxin component of YhaV-PrlF toxin-antitoxin module
MAGEVKDVRHTRISSKNQVTLPVSALRAAHLQAGDEVRVEVDAEGRITLTQEQDPLAAFVGALPGLSEATDLEGLRDEWER